MMTTKRIYSDEKLDHELNLFKTAGGTVSAENKGNNVQIDLKHPNGKRTTCKKIGAGILKEKNNIAK